MAQWKRREVLCCCRGLRVRSSSRAEAPPPQTTRRPRGTRKDGGVINLHWHDLRHECATRLWYDFRADLTTIQRMLGHSTPIVTQRYLNLTDDDLDERMHELWREARERKEKAKRFRVVAGARDR